MREVDAVPSVQTFKSFVTVRPVTAIFRAVIVFVALALHWVVWACSVDAFHLA